MCVMTIVPMLYTCGHEVPDITNKGCERPGSEECKKRAARNPVYMGSVRKKKVCPRCENVSLIHVDTETILQIASEFVKAQKGEKGGQAEKGRQTTT